LEDKLLFLLKQQRIYWKQCGKWVTDGDAGTKFFHANATIKHRRNLITSLVDQNSTPPQFAHHLKANILWDAYKDKLGKSEFQSMELDLNELLQASNELGCLEDPFTNEEIDRVIQNLPSDKSLGPDGFNIDFIKRC